MLERMSTLEDLCITRYLQFLESACATFLHLALQAECSLFEKLLPRILPTLKEQLESNMSGACSSGVRQEILRRLFSGEFPTSEYRRNYSEYNPLEEHTTPHLSESRDRIREIREHGRKCCSPCCTGVFLVETMACVIVNDELKEFKINCNIQNLILDKSRPIRKYLNFDLPSILSHYQASLLKHEEKRKPQLERFIIHSSDLPSREFAGLRDNPVKVLSVYQETQKYLMYPPYLASAALQDYSYPTQPFSEDLFLQVTDIFSKARWHFDKLTEIMFGSELRHCSVTDRYGDPMMIKLFGGIGQSCPNLKVLDISGSLHIPAEAFLYLFFRHANQCLHKYTYLPPYEVDLSNFNMLSYSTVFESKDVYKHSTDMYCPWCVDEWASNGVRFGGETMAVPYPVIDDKLYNQILEKHPIEGPKYLVQVLKASDLWRSAFEPNPILQRPTGPDPWAPDFVPPPISPVRDGSDENFLWYPPEDEKNVVYIEEEFPDTLTDLCDTLQILKIGQMGPRHEVLPFFIKALHNVKSLGGMDIMRGLKFMRDNKEIVFEKDLGLEEVYIDIVSRHYSHDWLTATRWACPEIRKDIEQFFRDQDGHQMSLEQKRMSIQEDINLLVSSCPHISKISLFLYMEEYPSLLGSQCSGVWEGLRSLDHLVDLTVLCIDWENSTALLNVIGSKLRKLCLSVSLTRSISEETSVQGPALNQLFRLCPNLQCLKVDVGKGTLNLSSEMPTELDLSKLNKFSAGTFLTQSAFEWLWQHAVGLEEILVQEICNSDTIQIFVPSTYQVYYNQSMLASLLKKNKMENLVKIKVYLCLVDIQAAEFLINTLRENCKYLVELGKLTVRVKLSEDHYPAHEDLLNAMAQITQAMRRFRQKCVALNLPPNPLKVQWSWEKLGLLQSFGDLEPINALINPPE